MVGFQWTESSNWNNDECDSRDVLGQIKNCDVHHSTSVPCIELVANMTTCATFKKNMSVVYGVKTNIRLTISHIFVVHVYFFSKIFGSTPPFCADRYTKDVGSEYFEARS